MKSTDISFIFILSIAALLMACSESNSNPPEDAIKREVSSILGDTYILYKDFPSEIVTPRNVEVWLPSTYELLDSLPVLYMFDGQNIFHGTKGWSGEFNLGWQVDETLDSLNKTGTVPDMIVVGIFNLGMMRGAEYMPQKPHDLVTQRIKETTHDWYKQYKETPPQSDDFLRFVVEELKPAIDKNFRTIKGPQNTYLAGSSMGGLISAYAICEYPKVFGGAACFSTHWPPLEGVFVDYITENLPDPKTHKVYFDYGTEGLDAEYEPYQNLVDEAMKAKGYEQGKNWVTKKFEGQDHHEVAWRNRFHVPMEFLMGMK